MMALFVVFFAFLISMQAADTDFDGRWNLKVLNYPRTRVWCLEVEGAAEVRLGRCGGDVMSRAGGPPDARPHGYEMSIEGPDRRLQLAGKSRDESVYKSNGVVRVFS